MIHHYGIVRQAVVMFGDELDPLLVKGFPKGYTTVSRLLRFSTFQHFHQQPYTLQVVVERVLLSHIFVEGAHLRQTIERVDIKIRIEFTEYILFSRVQVVAHTLGTNLVAIMTPVMCVFR